MNWQKQKQHVIDRIAYIPGGTDRDDNTLLVISTAAKQECSYEHLVNLLALLSDTLPSSTLFTVLIDTRHIQLKQLKFYLRACQQALYKRVRQVLIIQPDKFLDQQKLNFDLIINGYTLRTVLTSLHKLSKFVEIHQLPEEFGGTLSYDPDEWLDNRLEITKWNDYIVEAGADRSKHDLEKDEKLEEFIIKLFSTRRVDDDYAANQLKKSINNVKLQEENDSKEGLLKEHAEGVRRWIDWIEGSGEKWLNSLCQVSDNVDEADSLVKQHEQLVEKTKGIEEQTQQLAEMATRLMAVCPKQAITLKSLRDQAGEVGDHFVRRVEAQTHFAVSNRAFQGKIADFTKQTDSMLEQFCAEDENSSEDVEELQKKRKELDEQLSILNIAYESAMEAGRETIRKANQFADVLPAEQFISHIGSSLTYITQKQNRCNDLANVKKLKLQQLIQLFVTYGDCDQAIKWLDELKHTLHTEYGLADIDEEAVKNLRLDRMNLDKTAQSTYEYGKQLLQMAKTSESATLRENPNDDRKEKLEKAWKELDESIKKNEARLRVVESFMVTHRQMMERVQEIDKTLRERLRVSGKLNQITMSTERRRLRNDIEELSSIGRMLSAQINGDHLTSPDERQSVMKQITDKVDEVVTAQRRMESLITEEDEGGVSSESSGRDDKHNNRKIRPLSMLPEEEGDISPILPRAVRLIETPDGHTPAIRLSKNESYL